MRVKVLDKQKKKIVEKKVHERKKNARQNEKQVFSCSSLSYFFAISLARSLSLEANCNTSSSKTPKWDCYWIKYKRFYTFLFAIIKVARPPLGKDEEKKPLDFYLFSFYFYRIAVCYRFCVLQRVRLRKENKPSLVWHIFGILSMHFSRHCHCCRHRRRCGKKQVDKKRNREKVNKKNGTAAAAKTTSATTATATKTRRAQQQSCSARKIM